MGCGESKLAVATSNTILRRKKSNVDGDQSPKKSKDIETVEKANTAATNANGANSPMQQQQQEDRQKSEEVKEDNINNNIVNVKDINVTNEEEGIDGIISDSRSGTSDYFTPRHGRNLQFKVDDDIAEDAQELNQDLASPGKTKALETERNGLSI